MDTTDIQTDGDYWEYCTLYSQYIFVRVKQGGKWGPVSLEELEPTVRVHHIKRMLADGHLPCRVKTDGELAGR